LPRSQDCRCEPPYLVLTFTSFCRMAMSYPHQLPLMLKPPQCYRPARWEVRKELDLVCGKRAGSTFLISVWFQGSYFGTENLKSLVLHFLQQ
jgi:hypothetical protein